MNKVMLIGRLTKDVEVSETNSKKEIAKYTLAVRRTDEETDFIRCTAFGKTAEFAEKYFTQGLRVGIVGNIHTGSYENRDGDTIYFTDVIVETQYFADGNPESSKSNTRRNKK